MATSIDAGIQVKLTPSARPLVSAWERVGLLLYFAATLFLSAFLLFLVQPLIGKMILPRLGGSPAVWNACMVFFQAALLAGYAYAHYLSTRLHSRLQIIVHAIVLVSPFVVLPFAVADWKPSADVHPFFSVMGILAVLVGLPFFVVATTGPLLQKWFAETGHPSAKDPYFLYGASNLGSMLALVLYPVLIEPRWPIAGQSWIWATGYGLLALLIGGCALQLWRLAKVNKPLAVEINGVASAFDFERPVTIWRRLRWVGLAAAPSSLMLGVTTYLTTDIAPVPLFWVIPLAMYLGTFILVFMRWPWLWTGTTHLVVLILQPAVLLLLLYVWNFTPNWPEYIYFGIHLSAFFLTALMCHGELAKDRPPATHLTEFYFLLSLGGVLGGLFNAIVAPTFFWIGPIEYWIAFGIALSLRPGWLPITPLIRGDSRRGKSTWIGVQLDVTWPWVIGVTAYLIFRSGFEYPWSLWWLSIPLAMWLIQLGRPRRLGYGFVAFALAVILDDRRYELNDGYNDSWTVHESRGFFGFLKVEESQDWDGYVTHQLLHGRINHGVQVVDDDPEVRRKMIGYFSEASGVGQTFDSFWWPNTRLPASLVGLGTTPLGQLVATQSEPPVAVIGLGIGALGGYARPYQHFRFFEIDPAVMHLSLPPQGEKRYFHYLQDAIDRGADLKVVLGDGRLSLRDAPNRYYHALVVDAFSSDAIPVHLLTKEAFELYLQKIADGGVLVINITNRYLDLKRVVAELAEYFDLSCVHYPDNGVFSYGYENDWIVLQRNPDRWYDDQRSYNGGLPLGLRLDIIGYRWQFPQARGDRLWTDDYSNLMGIMNLGWGN